MYITVDDTIQDILQTGPGTLLAKVDIEMPSAYSLCIQLTDASRQEWRRMVDIDTCLPFGLSSAPWLFNILADLLTWSVQQSFVIHYHDDFLALCHPSSEMCQQNLDILTHLYNYLAVLLAALEELEGPSTTISILFLKNSIYTAAKWQP